MIWICTFLALICIAIVITILYINAYNKIIVYKIKMDYSNEIISDSLKKKLEKMNSLYQIIKKQLKKKDYLKEFVALKNKNLSNYELEKELNEHLTIMKNLQEDYKELRTEAFDNTLSEISELDQIITANKVFFNKNNNLLIKDIKGYIKIVAKLNKINIKNSYEIKEPM